MLFVVVFLIGRQGMDLRGNPTALSSRLGDHTREGTPLLIPFGVKKKMDVLLVWVTLD